MISVHFYTSFTRFGEKPKTYLTENKKKKPGLLVSFQPAQKYANESTKCKRKITGKQSWETDRQNQNT